jgi:hypothetical protein
MFEMNATGMHCPRCGDAVGRKLTHGGDYDCPICRAHFEVLMGQDQTVALVERYRPSAPPLGLPRGSVRALIALALLTAACWMVLAQGRAPDALLSLLLTIIGFYFGFRNADAGGRDRIHDPYFKQEPPLLLPPGAIRKLMILAVVIMAIGLGTRGLLAENDEYLGFFFSIAGLVIGHLFERYLSAPAAGGSLEGLIKHGKALVCLTVAAALVFLFITGADRDVAPVFLLVLCGMVSFYYGSRK